MDQPKPITFFMGGIALLYLAMVVYSTHTPAFLRYGGAAACGVLGLLSVGIGIRRVFEKKPERPRFVSRRQKTPADLGEDRTRTDKAQAVSSRSKR